MRHCIRHCVECPSCLTRYLVIRSPYGNGSYLVTTAGGAAGAYILFCACGQPPSTRRCNLTDAKSYAVSKAAQDRGYGSRTEIFELRRSSRRMKPVISFALLFFAALNVSVSRPTSSADHARPRRCTSPEYRQFDFWIGDWDVFEAGNPTSPVAHARVERILQGCVLLEDYQRGTLEGQSFSMYDALSKTWRQTWVTNQGELALIDGRLEGNQMVLKGIDHTGDGVETQIRGIWQSAAGGVRETALSSADGGKTWKPWFDLVFRPRTPARN